MNKQFFGKETGMWLLVCAVVYALAPLAWWQSSIALALLIATCFVMAWLTRKDLVLGLSLVFVELAIGGHGLLVHESIGVGVFTLRHALFLGFFAGYAWRLLRKEEAIRGFSALGALIAFCVWLFVSFVVGGLQNGWMVSFDEFNSYFYFAFLIPIFNHKS